MAIQTGDLIQRQSKLWLVHKIDPATDTAFIESQDREKQILGVEADCPIPCNPLRDWPAITTPPRKGRLLEVHRPSSGGVVILKWLLDWAKIDEFQIGGTLYLNPELRLGFGDQLILRYQVFTREVNFPIKVPRDFQPMSQKRIVRERPPPERTSANLYDHLLEDE